MNIQEKVEAYLGKPVAQASDREIYDNTRTARRSSITFRQSS